MVAVIAVSISATPRRRSQVRRLIDERGIAVTAESQVAQPAQVSADTAARSSSVAGSSTAGRGLPRTGCR